MKKLFYILLPLLSFGLGSCVDLTQHPQSFLTEEEYIQIPQNYETVEKGVTGLYHDLWDSNYGFNCRLMRLNIQADDIVTSPKPNNSLNYLKDLYPNLSANDADQGTIWKNMWKVINNSTKIITGTPIPADEQQAKIYRAVVAEARFVRGLAYFYLVRIFGDVPLVLKGDDKDIYQPREAVAVIYEKAIIPDLEEAIKHLPEKSRKEDSSTPTKWAAQVCLADVYMNLAGWPLKRGAEAYAKAAALTQEIIAKAGLSLTPEYGDLWRESKKFETNEHMFSLIHNASYNASQYGKSFWARDYVGGGWADYLANPAFMAKYPADARKAFNFMTEWKTKTGVVQWENSQDKLPIISKYHDYDNGPHGKSAQSNGLTPIYRYADVLLIHAEASNLATGVVSDLALKCLQDVQTRAKAATLTTTRESAAFDQAVLDERGWEFFAEFRRWFDLVRREKVGEIRADKWDGSLYKAQQHYYLPVPSSQIEMTGWENNKGY